MRAAEPLRLMVFDRTCAGRRGLPGLSRAWLTGGLLYRGLRRLHATRGVSSWSEALEWIATHERSRSIASIQFWGHGKWGEARVGDEPLDVNALKPTHYLHSGLQALKERLLADGSSLFWFRTCETLGADPGHDFARRFSEQLNARIAGHTYIIGPWQSGLHSLAAGETPSWSAEEGLLEGSTADPRLARWSRRGEPNTIHCLQGQIPAGY